MRIITSIFILLSAGGMAVAQAPVSNEKPADLKALEEKFSRTFVAERLKAEGIAAATGRPLKFEGANGEIVEFAGFAANGHMLYNRTSNVGSGRTISTNKVWPGGGAGTSLSGINLPGRMGEWDGGAIYTSNSEFGGRVSQVDAPATYSTHSTHVAGTMVASGVSPNAKGMAYQGSLKAYDWNNAETEMTQAAANGMIISNHSYGAVCGWYHNEALGRWEWYGDEAVSTTIDYKYGFYDQGAADWDNIARANPYFLICKAAGNDRGNTYSGAHYVRDAGNNWVASSAPRAMVGAYDCMEPKATAKNVLTVGAVQKIGNSNTNNGWTKTSDVVMSSFSGWGPTDDGRIKPDVVAAGVDIYSTYTASSYFAQDGTSMATPAVTASLLLVQQHTLATKGIFLKSATLKALAIHTADEAGLAGPDYIYGWGLLNTAKAVGVVSDTSSNQIAERSLTTGTSYSQIISSDAQKPLRITIAWTDPAAQVSSIALNDTTRKLVNDLDIRLRRISDNVLFSPYVLNPATPAYVATTGDNFRDNVEQIYIAAPQAGLYTLTVTHKGTLVSGSQNYALIMSGISMPPKAYIAKSSSNVCTNENVQFTDVSTGSPASRKWYFPGATPSSGTAASITVFYPSPGKYPVSLVVTNALGSDSVFYDNYVTVGGLTPPFTETFETSSTTLAAWAKSNPGSDTTWRLATVTGTTPGNQAYCLPFFNYASIGQRDGLISPAFNLVGMSTASLTFKHAYTRADATGTDSLLVYVSTNCGTSWTQLSAVGENGSGTLATAPNSTFASSSYFTPSSANNWCGGTTGAACFTINLTPYAGLSNVKVKFEGYNNYGNNLYIDNVNVGGTLLLPIANFKVSKTTACPGEVISFADSSQNIVSGWQWTFTGATPSTSTQQNPTGIVYSAPGIYSVKLKVSNSSGSDSITKTAYITVLPGPGKPNIKGNRSLVLCPGDSVTLRTDSTAVSYKWLSNNLLLSGADTPSITVKAGASYKVVSIAANGCENASNAAVVSNQAAVPTPTFTSTITGTSFCTGGVATFYSNASNGNRWYKNGVNNPADTNNSFATSDSGTYTLKVVVNGCSSSFSAPKTYSLVPKPAPLTITGNSTTFFTRTEPYSVTANTGSTYAWTIVNGSQLSGGTTASIQVKWATSASGTVQVRETASSGCKGDVATLNVSLALGINETPWMKNLSVYPNPASQALHIEFESTVKQDVIVKLFSVTGKEVYSETVKDFNGLYRQAVQTGLLAKGLYLLEVGAGAGASRMKVIVE